MKHLDLFSGIGGFSLALDNVFHEEEIEHTFVEWDDFCQEVLRKHWPNASCFSDIKRFIADAKLNKHRTEQREVRKTQEISGIGREALDSGWFGGTTIITGGFPCQPFSQAGRRQGTADDRYLWPAMYECVALFKPEWVVAENVAGLVTWNDGLVLETVCTDLEREGYEVQPFVIPACAVGAPHRRDRVWIVAHKRGSGLQKKRPKQQAAGTRGKNIHATDTSNKGLQRGRKERTRQRGQPDRAGSDERSDWNKNWVEVATEFCRVDDGIPKRLDRASRLKALGNAIVPQVAEEIFRAIKEIDL